MSEQLKLAACPFCGSCGGEIMDFRGHLGNRIQCGGCNVSTDTFLSYEEAHAAWNTRAATGYEEESERAS